MSVARRLERVPIRWRLALTSAGLTFAILALFAVVIGAFTASRVRADFDRSLVDAASDLQTRVRVGRDLAGEPFLQRGDVVQALVRVAASGDAAARVVDTHGQVIAPAAGAPDLGPPAEGVRDVGAYRVASEPLYAGSFMPVAFIQYGRERRSLEATVARVKAFLGLGVLGGALLALLAGLAVARRAMAPVGRLTRAAEEITRTRDPAVRLPAPAADDEVGDLSRTLAGMLRALDEARAATEATLARQREFLADASHELRTPLTSVLANLELLEASLAGEDREAAASALRSSRRMRRLVADLLLLARADAGRARPVGRVDLGAVVRDAAAEAAPLAAEHELAVEAPDGAGAGPVVEGSGDELHRLALNLIENALVHTPAGTSVRAAVRAEGSEAVLEVVDDGPGVPAELRERAFERFVRGAGAHDAEARAGTGLGLAIVRAVAERHGGSVALAGADGAGSRFTVRLPLAPTEPGAAASPGHDEAGRRPALG